ncbi:enolase C-terminal domain-like protein [Arenibacter sp. ARW7G5Y1]|uniref:enolase C-terminal domain-like protein n=1 Tax=Arenibacter sp. ARW7G5Y1 TaxID=2135619 RepID=UPI000D76559A|nr:enolase C-terminal domain-like protein [Arenibacter sp. ARW7G5Y1]PXX23031.1 L-fuconate dehydratase [Arenibacter sp. ARW7G5Y1]
MNKTIVIKKGYSNDIQYPLKNGAGSDAIHTTPIYAYAVCKLQTDCELEGVGLAFTLGTGNKLVCDAISYLVKHIEGKEIHALMANFGETYKAMADDPNFRWLGPHKGVVHLALASVVNACYDLWAKSKEIPLWKLLIDLSPEELVNTLDFSYYEDALTKEEAISILVAQEHGKENRKMIVDLGYPGYDTSIGWFNYSDEQVETNIKKALDNGFSAMKLKVGSKECERDVRRASLVRKIAGDNATIMFDANQQWNLPQAISICKKLKELNPYWIEEPTHPDDVQAHVDLAKAVDVKLALGEHVPNKITFKNFIRSGSMAFNQVDAVRVGGISEFILISLLSRKYNIPVVPHVGDMGQIHQHLVLFNHISIGHPALLLEHIPHLQDYFKFPVSIVDGRYKTPHQPGISADLKVY